MRKSLETIETVLGRALQVRPSLVLDVGLEFGRYGLLLREFLEEDPLRRSTWSTTIDGVAFAESKVMPHHLCIYDKVHVVHEDKHWDEVLEKGYDLALVCDVLDLDMDWELLLDRLKVIPNLVVTVPFLNGSVENPRVVFTQEMLNGYFHSIEQVGQSLVCWR